MAGPQRGFALTVARPSPSHRWRSPNFSNATPHSKLLSSPNGCVYKPHSRVTILIYYVYYPTLNKNRNFNGLRLKYKYKLPHFLPAVPRCMHPALEHPAGGPRRGLVVTRGQGREATGCTWDPGEAPGGGGGRCYSFEPLGKRNLWAATGTPRNSVGSLREGPDLGDLDPGEPGHGNPGQKDRGRELRERGDSGLRESPGPGSGSSRDRSSTRCHFSWTCWGWGLSSRVRKRRLLSPAGAGRSRHRSGSSEVPPGPELPPHPATVTPRGPAPIRPGPHQMPCPGQAPPQPSQRPRPLQSSPQPEAAPHHGPTPAWSQSTPPPESRLLPQPKDTRLLNRIPKPRAAFLSPGSRPEAKP